MFKIFGFVIASIILPIYPILLLPLLLVTFGRRFINNQLQDGYCKCNIDLNGKTALITGGNSGIGKETAKFLAKRGCKVIIGCRNTKQGKEVAKELRKETFNQDIKCLELDLANFPSIHEFSGKVISKERKLDYLICNAGIGWDSDHPKITSDGQEMIFQTNYLGHFLLCNLLLNLVKASDQGRIISVAGLSYLWPKSVIPYNDLVWNNTPWDPLAAYGQSNLARILFTRELARQAKVNGDQFSSYAVHPGIVKTQFNRQKLLMDKCTWKEHFENCLKSIYEELFFKSPEAGAQTILHCCLSQELSRQSGRLYMDCKDKSYEGKIAMDREEAIKLWNVSMKLCGDPTPLPLSDSDVGNKSYVWKYVGRKRRTAL